MLRSLRGGYILEYESDLSDFVESRDVAEPSAVPWETGFDCCFTREREGNRAYCSQKPAIGGQTRPLGTGCPPQNLLTGSPGNASVDASQHRRDIGAFELDLTIWCLR